MGKLAAGTGIIIAARLGAAWALMLLVGVIHADWLPALRPIGYGTAVLLQLLLALGQMVLATSGALVQQLFPGNPTKGGQLPRRTPGGTFSQSEWDRLFPGRTRLLRWNDTPL